MIFITGDTHGDFTRFSSQNFPEQQTMTKKDYVIICGDFGGIWNGSKEEEYWLDWLDEKPFTTLFVTGNHENYDLLKTYPFQYWNGGRVQRIRPSILHLTRGQIFEISGKTFFTMGGASSHDISDGILDPNDPDFKKRKDNWMPIMRSIASTIELGGKKSFHLLQNMRRQSVTSNSMVEPSILWCPIAVHPVFWI